MIRQVVQKLRIDFSEVFVPEFRRFNTFEVSSVGFAE